VQHLNVAGTGGVHLARASARVDHVVGGINGTYAIANGTLSALTSGAPAYDLQTYVPAGDVSTALHTLQLPTLYSDGTFNGNLHVSGRGLSPAVSGPLNVPAGSVNGLPFVDGNAVIDADRSGVIARRGNVLVGTTHVRWAAGMRPYISGLLVRAPVADLSDFNNFFDTGDTLDGSGSLRFDLVSQRHRISSNGAVDISGFRYRNMQIGDTDASWSSAHNKLRGALAVGGAQGLLRARGSIGFEPSTSWQNVVKDSHYDIALTLENLDLSLSLAALGFPQIPVTGRVDGTASVSGTYPELRMNGVTGLSGGTFWRLPLDQFSMAFSAHGGRFYIDKALMEAPGVAADASGSIGLQLNDQLNLDVHATSNNLPALVTEIAGTQIPVSGTFETSAHVGGTFTKPTFSGGFDAQDVDAYGIHVASIFGSVRLHEKTLELRNAGAVFARGQATIAGSLPLVLQPFGIGPAEAPISLDLAIADLDPSIFDRVFGNNTRLGGTVDGAVQVAGNVRSPRIYGRFALRDGSYVSDLEHVPITQTVASLTFDRSQATVDRLSAHLGNGSIEGSGRIAFAKGFSSAGGEGASFDVRARANGAQLDLPAYGRGTLDGSIAFSRAVGHDARLSGDALLSNATIPFSAFLAGLNGQQGGATSGLSPLALDFDLNLAAGRGVRVRGTGYGAGLDIGAAGSTHLGGSLGAPTMDGQFVSTGGTLTYFDRAFRVQSAMVTFTPSAGIIPTMHAVGTTHVVNPDPDPARNPYGSADITIKLDGPIDGLKVAFESNPPNYSQEQILAMIAPFGGFINGISYNPVTGVEQPGTTTPLGALQPLPGRPAAQSAGTISVGQEAFNILNAQFTAGLLSPFETALSQGLGFSDVNVTVDYFGNVGVSARRLLGKEVSLVYATTFGIPSRQSVGLEVNPNGTTSGQLSFFWQTGPTRLFETPTAGLTSNSRLSVGQSVQGQSGFSFLLQRSFW
jgi:autotransporter translocation and assembly factor TamB